MTRCGQGDLLANRPVSWSVSIVCITNGYWDVEGHAAATTDSGTLGAHDTLYIRVFGDEGEVSSIPFSQMTTDRPPRTHGSQDPRAAWISLARHDLVMHFLGVVGAQAT